MRSRIGADELAALIQESLAAAHRGGALKPEHLERITVDTTVQPKAVAFPTDAKLMHKAREMLVRPPHEWGVEYPGQMAWKQIPLPTALPVGLCR